MGLRSWLIVPADSEAKLIKAPEVGADVVVLDLASSVAPDAKNRARELAAGWLRRHGQQVTAERRFARWVRINPLDSRMSRDDLIAVLPSAPDGIMLPRASGPEAVQQLAAELYEIEQRSGVQTGSTRVLPVAGETAASALTIPAYVEASLPRLAGLTWGAETLAAAIGASRARNVDGSWADAARMVRTQTLLAAHARGLIALEAAPESTDTKMLKRAAEAARADGFTGMLATHPAQVAAINAAFTPSEAELVEARAIVAAFSGDGGALDRRSIDPARLKLAQRLLGLEE
jgi:citrate lyase subunit beta / citryl-CoA lyase